jgi:hypothetical protein
MSARPSAATHPSGNCCNRLQSYLVLNFGCFFVLVLICLFSKNSSTA